MEEPSAGCGAPAWRRDDPLVAPATVRWLLLRRGLAAAACALLGAAVGPLPGC